MRFFLVTPLVLMLALASVALASTSTQDDPAQDTSTGTTAGAPRARIESTHHDWGKLLKGQTSRFTYIIHNDGSGDLRITQVRPSCGCTTERFTKGQIPPGGVAEVELVIDTSKLVGGPHEKRASIFTTDPENSEIKVTLGGEIIPVFNTIPEELSLVGLASDEKVGSFELVKNDGLDFELLEVLPRMGGIKVVQIETIEAQSRYRIHVRAGASLPTTRREQIDVKLRTVKDGVERTEILNLVVEHLDRIILEPTPSVIFRRQDTESLVANPPTVPTHELTLRAAQPNIRFEILGTTFEGPQKDVFDAKVETIVEGSHYRVTVSLKEHLDLRFTRAKLQIRTSDPAAPLKEVRVFAQFSPQAPKSQSGSPDK